jgi:Spy/CpxP family protein refolding chaperone
MDQHNPKIASMKNLIKAAFIALVVVFAPAYAQDSTAPSTREMVVSQLGEYKTSLNLTDYQWTQVEMILKSSIRERLAIAQRYGLDGGGEAYQSLERKQKRQLKKELKASREGAEDRMKRFLDKEQFKEFKAVQESIYDEFLSRAQALEAG